MSQSQTMETIATSLKTETDNPQGVLALQFIKVNDYNTFEAEFAITEGDIVFHFFVSPEIAKWSEVSLRKFWGETFPGCLVLAGRQAFNADAPRIKGQHIHDPEMGINSWWFRAYGFGHLLDPHALAYKFFDTLDASLDTAIKSIP